MDVTNVSVFVAPMKLLSTHGTDPPLCLQAAKGGTLDLESRKDIIFVISTQKGQTTIAMPSFLCIWKSNNIRQGFSQFMTFVFVIIFDE